MFNQKLSKNYSKLFKYSCALGSTIRIEYYYIKYNKIYKSAYGKNNILELNVDDFLYSLGVHCIVVGIPIAFKTVFFHVYGIGFIIVSAINYIS
jgi:hypothetical protein